MASIVVEREDLIKMVEDWLNAANLREGDQLEVTFMPREVVIRPQSTEKAELDQWLDQATRKYDSVLRRLADS